MFDWFFDFLLGKGGLFVIPLLVLSFLGLLYFIERAIYLHRGQIRTGEFVEGVKNLLAKQRLVEALTVCEETPGVVPMVVKAALLNHDQSEAQLVNAVKEAAFIQIPVLERRIGSLAAIAKLAPMIGFLGTLVALFKLFADVQAEGSFADFSLVSGNISMALITTCFGVAVAVVTLIAHHFLNGRVRALVHDMQWAGHAICEYLVFELDTTDASDEASEEG